MSVGVIVSTCDKSWVGSGVSTSFGGEIWLATMVVGDGEGKSKFGNDVAAISVIMAGVSLDLIDDFGVAQEPTTHVIPRIRLNKHVLFQIVSIFDVDE